MHGIKYGTFLFNFLRGAQLIFINENSFILDRWSGVYCEIISMFYIIILLVIFKL